MHDYADSYILSEIELPDAQKMPLKRRRKIIAEIAKVYGDHPVVHQKIEAQRIHYTESGKEIVSSNIMDDYMRMAGSYNLFSADETHDLLMQIDEGVRMYESLTDFNNISQEQEDIFVNLTAARQAIFMCNLKLVVYTIRTYFPRVFYKDEFSMDIVSAGNEGLERAISIYDAEKGFLFSRYAVEVIKSKILDDFKQFETVKFSGTDSKDYKAALKTVRERQQELKRDLTDEEITQLTGVSADRLHLFKSQRNLEAYSFDQILDEYILPEKEATNFNNAMSYDMMRELNNLFMSDEIKWLFEVASLTDHEKFVIGLRMGMSEDIIGSIVLTKGDKKMSYREIMSTMTGDYFTQQEIADKIHLSRSRISQLEAQALAELKEAAELLTEGVVSHD